MAVGFAAMVTAVNKTLNTKGSDNLSAGNLKGTYINTIDEKGRMAFPSKLKAKLGDEFIITVGKDCLSVYSPDAWDEFTKKLRELSGSEARAAKIIVNRAIDAEPDKQGRITLSKDLREHAALLKDVTVVGVINHCEIWDSERYDKFKNDVPEEEINKLLDSFAF
jgi:MraZ protein